MISVFSIIRRCALAVALVCGLAAPTAAEKASVCAADNAAPMATPAAWARSVPLDQPADWTLAQWRGMGCERCNTRTHYCVVNFIRYEYVCAPRGNTFACAGSQGTRWCRLGQTCWDGVCR